MSDIEYINKNEFKISGILDWHKKGYTGKDVKIANIESCYTNAWFFKKQVNDPFSYGREDDSNSHGNNTINVINQVAPDADFYILPRGGSYSKNKVTGTFIEKTIPFLISEKIQLVNASLGGTNNKILNEAILNVQEHGTTFVCSAGNESDSGVGGYARSGVWIAVGAVVLTDAGKINLTSYSSVGEAVDFVQFGEIYVNDVRNNYKDRTIHCGGTSFSSPLLTGMLALVQQFFKETTGQYLKQNELCQFMIDNSTDLGDEGKDTKYGHGLFVLPDPDTIDINKYSVGEKPIEDNSPGGNNIITGFSDVGNDHWAKDVIAEMVDKGIFNGYPDGTFKPDQYITRAENAMAASNIIKYIVQNYK